MVLTKKETLQKNEKWNMYYRFTVKYCYEMKNDDKRGDFITTKVLAKNYFEQFDENTMSMCQHFGHVLQKVDFAEKWSRKQYHIDMDELPDISL